MIYKILLIGVLLFLGTTPSWGATRYIDGTLASTCSGSTYSIASRNCTGSDGTGYKTAPEGWRASVAGDIVYHRAGTYTVSSIYGNSASDTYGPGGSSWASATQWKNYPGEAVTINMVGFNMDNNVSTGGVNYLIIEGDSRANFIFQKTSGTGSGFRLNNGVHHVRWKTLTIRNFLEHGIQTGTGCTTKPTDIEIIDNEISNNGDSSAGNQNEHGIYPSCSVNWLIEKNYLLNNHAYGIHVYSSTTNYHTNATIRYNIVEGRIGALGTAFGILVATGSGHTIHHNVVIGLGSGTNRLQGGIHVYSGTGATVYNNTVYDTVSLGITVQQSSAINTVIKNNIFNTRLTDPIQDFGTTTTKANNHCQVADTGCSVTGSAGFVSAGTNFALSTTSTAIDAGTDVGYAYNGAAPEIGAFEVPVFASCVVEDGDASTLRVTFTNNLNPPLLPATGVTGFTARKATANDVITAAVVTGDNRIDLTLTNAIVAGNAVDISLVPASSNLTDSALIGGTLNQPYNTVLTNSSCTNNVGAAASHMFTTVLYEWHGKYGTEAAPELKPYDCVTCAADGTLENYVGMYTFPGGAARLRVAVQNSVADPPATGFLWYAARNGGAQFAVPATFGSDNLAFCGTSPSPDMPQNFSSTTNQTSATGTFASGAFLNTPNAVPTVDMALNGKTELEGCFAWDTDTAPNDYFEFYIKQQDGTALVNTVVPRIDIKSVAAGSGF